MSPKTYAYWVYMLVKAKRIKLQLDAEMISLYLTSEVFDWQDVFALLSYVHFVLF